jgi:hypothetical protein
MIYLILESGNKLQPDDPATHQRWFSPEKLPSFDKKSF